MRKLFDAWKIDEVAPLQVVQRRLGLSPHCDDESRAPLRQFPPASRRDPTRGGADHPEYPAAHGCLTGAQADIFAAFLGTLQIDIDLTSTVPGLAQPSRHYRSVEGLKTEIVNARVWAGLHYRSSVMQGLDLARRIVAFSPSGRFARSNR